VGRIDISAVEWLGPTVSNFSEWYVLAGAVMATALFSLRLLRKTDFKPAYTQYRSNLGRAILLGLEFLVAGDIIATILVEPTITRAGALGIIVLIRTFLSFSLETEIEGCWPWERARIRNDAPSHQLDPDGFR
jgi:uncharacterized membrane protein